MQIIPIIPVVVPMLAAALTLPLAARPRVQAAVGVAALLGVLAAAVSLLWHTSGGTIVKVEMSGWPAPFGIALVIDNLSAIMVLLTAIVGVASMLFAAASIVDQPGRDAQVPLMLMLLAAVSGAFMTGDLFNLYVWYELMLLSSFVLLTVGGTGRQFQAAVKYVALNLLSSTLFLASAGLIYGTLGTLNMAHLAVRLDALDPAMSTALAAPLLVAFAIKAAVFPFFFWLPASYHTPRPAVSALFAGLLTKVGVYSMIRACTLMFDQDWGLLGQVVLVIASLTMLSGVLGAVAQNDMRRILSFHIVSQIGYMLMGLGIAMAASAAAARATDPADAAALNTAAAIGMTGAVFYILHHIIAKTNLFLIAGAVMRVRGTSDLTKLGGLLATHPHLAIIFLISAFALAGIPILSGFWAKLALVRAGLEGGFPVVVTASLIVSVLTLFSMTKIWSNAFWRATPDGQDKPRPAGLGVLFPIGTMAALSVLVGVFAAPLYRLSEDAAGQLLDTTAYIEAVLPPEIIVQERGAIAAAAAPAPPPPEALAGLD